MSGNIGRPPSPLGGDSLGFFWKNEKNFEFPEIASTLIGNFSKNKPSPGVDGRTNGGSSMHKPQILLTKPRYLTLKTICHYLTFDTTSFHNIFVNFDKNRCCSQSNIMNHIPVRFQKITCIFFLNVKSNLVLELS